MREIIIDPVSIIVWKEHGEWDKFWNKLHLKKLHYNRLSVVTDQLSWLTSEHKLPSNAVVLKWNKDVKKSDLNILRRSLKYCKDDIERLLMFNIIVPDTFNVDDLDLDNFNFDFLLKEKEFVKIA